MLLRRLAACMSYLVTVTVRSALSKEKEQLHFVDGDLYTR
jgi:hypothetical protein